jgi:hypothetical protein
VLFGERAVEIEGHNLKVLVGEIREGQLSSIRELAEAQADLIRADADGEPIITGIRTYPDFEEMLREIKGENGREGRSDSGFAGRTAR